MWKTASNGVSLRLRNALVTGPLRARRPNVPTQRWMTGQQSKKKKTGGVVPLIAVGAVAGFGGVMAATQTEVTRQMLPDGVNSAMDTLLSPYFYISGTKPPAFSSGADVKPAPEKVKDPLQQESLLRKKNVAEETQPASVVKKEAETKAVKATPSVVKKEAEQKKTTPTVTKKEETKIPDGQPAPEATAVTVAMGTVAKAVQDKEKGGKDQKDKQQVLKEAKNNDLEKQIAIMLDSVSKTKTDAMAAMENMIETTKKHTEALKKALDDSLDISNKEKHWKEVSEMNQLRQKAEEISNKIQSEARSQIDKLRQVVTEAQNDTLTKDNKKLVPTLDSLNKAQDDLKAISSKVVKSVEESQAVNRFKELVEEGKKQFMEEIDSLVPDLKLGKKEKLTEEDLNTLIAHAHKKIEQLQSQIAKSVALEKEKIKEAREKQKLEDDKTVSQKVRNEAEKIKRAYLAEKTRWDENARLQFEDEMRHVLARQSAAHSDHLRAALLEKEKEVERQMEKKFVLDMLEQRQKFQEEVGGWLARLKGIEKAVSERLEADSLSEKTKQLWVASMAMRTTVTNGCEDKLVWEEKLRPLANEIVSIADASMNHPYISIVLSTIPEEAYERGVWTEDTLKQRFRKVQCVCKKVAIVDSAHDTLWSYFKSYVASLLIYPRVTAKTETSEVDVSSMDNYDILANAQYWMDEGRMEVAIRFMNLLTGEAKKVASDWLHEAKLFLETKQAADAIVAFAAAGSLKAMV